MTLYKFFFGTVMVLLTALLVFWVIKTYNKELYVAPDIEMIQNCETMHTSVHIFNPDLKQMKVRYDVYIDMNDNAILDSIDAYVYSEPKVILGSQAEHQGIIIGPNPKYKGYSFIVKATTDDVIAYYASIPCDVNLEERDSTPTK